MAGARQSSRARAFLTKAEQYLASSEDNLDRERHTVGDERSGRLVAEYEGIGKDRDDELFAVDVGVDGAAASAEEAAVHTVDE